MTDNRRIFWNIIATYGRSLFALVCGLLTGRWVLQSLGASDFGLFSIVGGMMVFISVFNNTLSSANSRFYAVSIGAAKVAKTAEALEECRKWFNTALSIHTVVPVILMMIGYPIGEWAIRNWLTVPVERIDACVWIFRISCVSCFVSMVNVPFQAMYMAKQYIAELTVYSFATTFLTFFFVMYMAYHPGNWLIRYALWTAVLVVVPQLIICIRALIIFPECKIVRHYLFMRAYLKKVISFSGWTLMGTFCGLLRGQGLDVLANKYFGPVVNASFGFAKTLDSKASMLSSAMQGAFVPAISTAYGERNLTRMKSLVNTTNKFSVLLSIIFVLPLSMEIKEVLSIWLVTPPPYLAGLTLIFFAVHLMNCGTDGHMLAVVARGRVKSYYVVLSAISIFTLPLAWLIVDRGHGPYGIGLVLAFMILLNSLGRVYFAKKEVGLGAGDWLVGTVVPLVGVVMSSVAVGLIPVCFFAPSLGRVCLTTAVLEPTMLVLSWLWLFSSEEREFILLRCGKWLPQCVQRMMR